MNIIYAIMATISVLLLIGYCTLIRKKEFWLLLLFGCITVVNVGYFMLSVAKTLEFAIFANDVVYAGSVFLSMCMLLTIVKLCGFEIKRNLVISCTIIGALMLSIILTSGFLPWYYKEVSLIFVDGAAKLDKVYGILHPVYLIYLCGYFVAMIACIVQSVRKKMIASQKHASLMAAIVFGNIAVWFVEKFIDWNFEFLSVSYLFSEIIFLALYIMLEDYVRYDLVPQRAQPQLVDVMAMATDEKILKVISHLSPGEMLTAREKEILTGIFENKKRKEIADELNLSENTIKTYTRTLYSKLSVSSREELYRLLTK